MTSSSKGTLLVFDVDTRELMRSLLVFFMQISDLSMRSSAG